MNRKRITMKAHCYPLDIYCVPDCEGKGCNRCCSRVGELLFFLGVLCCGDINI